jgi:lipopolysaccharide export system ATP-binding protein
VSQLLQAPLLSPPGCDLSVLVAVHVLLRSDGEWVPMDRLMSGVQDAYRDLDEAGETSGPSLGRFPPEEARRYLEEHVLGRLSGEGVADLQEGEGGEETVQAARIAPALAPAEADRDRALEEIEARMHAAAHPPVADRVTEPAPDAGPRSRLRGTGLVKVYKKRRVVDQVDLEVRQGEIVGLLGPNGAGKTTTFYMLVGLIRPDGGRVFLDGENLTGIPMYRRARRGIGYLSQEPSVFRKLTVEENVLAVLEMLGLSKRERHLRLESLLDELGIKHLRKAKAYALSGGERRRLEITRALVGQPKFMLLDEPFAGVDPIAVHDIQQIVSDLRRRNIGVLISDHNVEQTLDIVDRAYIMYDGRVRVSGTVAELVWNDEAAEIYLGPTLTERMRGRYPRPDRQEAGIPVAAAASPPDTSNDG